MKIKQFVLPLFLVGTALFACERAQKSSAATLEPLSPEEVIRLYQSYLDQNLFEEAKKLSTEKELERLEEISRIIAEENQDSTRMNSVFLELSCTIQNDSARCACKIKDQYETYDTEFFLVKVLGRWLVDAAPQEEILFDEEEIEGILDSMMEQIR